MDKSCCYFGEFKCDKELKLPWNAKKVAYVDKCIHRELSKLIKLGITTQSSCCGHFIKRGYVYVATTDDIKKMERMGYEHDTRSAAPDHTFFLKFNKNLPA